MSRVTAWPAITNGTGISEASARDIFVAYDAAQSLSDAEAAQARTNVKLVDGTGSVAITDASGTTQYIPKYDTAP